MGPTAVRAQGSHGAHLRLALAASSIAAASLLTIFVSFLSGVAATSGLT